jgi:hypothetical protein
MAEKLRIGAKIPRLGRVHRVRPRALRPDTDGATDVASKRRRQSYANPIVTKSCAAQMSQRNDKFADAVSSKTFNQLIFSNN